MDAYRIAYDGRSYHGFQRQPDVDTVEGLLLDALTRLGIANEQPPSGYSAAGRTDAGASALAQTVAFDAPNWLRPAALNTELPEDIHAWAHAEVPPDFHATHDPLEREYRYILDVTALDTDRLRTALDRMIGEHDFHNLTADRHRTRRRIRSISIERADDLAVITIRAGGFCRQQVRRMIALARQVATGSVALDFIDRILDSEPISGGRGIGPLPAEPLVLTAVDYPPEIEFTVDHTAADRVESWFTEQATTHRIGARVATEIASGIR